MTDTEPPPPQSLNYPQVLKLPRGRTVQVRPMRAEDADALHSFFSAIPEEDLLFLRRDVTDRDVIESWARDVSDGRTFTLLAEQDGRVVGEASVHRSRVPWSAHVGEIRVVVDAAQRRSGLGTALVQRAFMQALHEGIEKLVAEMTPDQKGAINVFQKLGFRVEGLFQDHVRDRRGGKHDLLVMAHEVHGENDLLAQYGVVDAMEA
jgi:RimJ/RimL family protein N-acetyltransferase